MRISIANISKKVTTPDFSATVHAVARQVHQDFAPLWGMDADVRGIAMNREAKPKPELTLSDVILYVGELNDDPQKVADAVGYHDLNNKGIPFGFVFTDVAAKAGEAWFDDAVARSARAPRRSGRQSVGRGAASEKPEERGLAHLRGRATPSRPTPMISTVSRCRTSSPLSTSRNCRVPPRRERTT